MSHKTDISQFFGNSVRKIRVAQGISQEELAHRAGLHRTYVGMVERAERNITLKNIEKIATALCVPITTLFPHESQNQKC